MGSILLGLLVFLFSGFSIFLLEELFYIIYLFCLSSVMECLDVFIVLSARYDLYLIFSAFICKPSLWVFNTFCIIGAALFCIFGGSLYYYFSVSMFNGFQEVFLCLLFSFLEWIYIPEFFECAFIIIIYIIIYIGFIFFNPSGYFFRNHRFL